MKANELIIYAVFMAGVALFYDTEEVCKEVASSMTGAVLVRINSFNDIK